MRVSIPLLLWVRWNRRTHCFDVMDKKVLHGRQIVKFLLHQFALSPWDHLMSPGNCDGRICEFAKRTKKNSVWFMRCVPRAPYTHTVNIVWMDVIAYVRMRNKSEYSWNANMRMCQLNSEPICSILIGQNCTDTFRSVGVCQNNTCCVRVMNPNRNHDRRPSSLASFSYCSTATSYGVVTSLELRGNGFWHFISCTEVQ